MLEHNDKNMSTTNRITAAKFRILIRQILTRITESKQTNCEPFKQDKFT